MELEAVQERRYRKRAPHIIRVLAFDIKLDQQVRDLVIDLSKDGKKDWLFDFILWATKNGIAVEIERKENEVSKQNC